MKNRIAKLFLGSSLPGLRLLATALPLLAAVDRASAQGVSGPCDQVTTDVNALCLLPSDQSVLLDDSFTVELAMSFFDSTVGGDVFLAFDPSALSLSGVTFDPSLPDDPDFRCPGLANCQPNQLAFGTLSELSGLLDVLTLSFQALQPGTHAISLQNDQFADGQGNQLPVQLFGSSVSVVPEPATSSLMALGLIALARLRHRSCRGSHRHSSAPSVVSGRPSTSSSG